jgi:hypothetical protein
VKLRVVQVPGGITVCQAVRDGRAVVWVEACYSEWAELFTLDRVRVFSDTIAIPFPMAGHLLARLGIDEPPPLLGRIA